ncbi:clustered mitochondria protein [Spatholobus suberectus]|nr:clustered mitochondria protein [Spatholobus suberectus]
MGDESPKNKVKFLCSYGGKVLPRPSDGLLRYVGGETRVVSVPRDVNFCELMKKMSSMVEGEMVLKYQLVPEDLDALVSVRTEEDVKHMIEEHDRHQTGLLRAFLFPPSKPPLLACEPYLLEQRYIDAINGINRTSPRAPKGSASPSPKSTSPDAADYNNYSPRFPNVNAMHRVRSSPSLTNLPGDHHPHLYPSSTRPLARKIDYLALGGTRPPPLNYYNYSNTRQPHTHTHKGYPYQDDSAPYAQLPLERLHTLPRTPPTKSIWD